MARRAHILVSGRVQGVCYRMYTVHEARRLCLTGWVRNLPDGRVEVVAEGNEGALGALFTWCSHGPSHAVVHSIHDDYSAPTGEFTDFDIKF